MQIALTNLDRAYSRPTKHTLRCLQNAPRVNHEISRSQQFLSLCTVCVYITLYKRCRKLGPPGLPIGHVRPFKPSPPILHLISYIVSGMGQVKTWLSQKGFSLALLISGACKTLWQHNILQGAMMTS